PAIRTRSQVTMFGANPHSGRYGFFPLHTDTPKSAGGEQNSESVVFTPNLLDGMVTERIVGRAEVREMFLSPNGNVAGCLVTEGHLRQGSRIRVVRVGVVIYDGQL